MSTPMIRTLKNNFPKAQIDYMVGKWSKEMIEDNIYIDQVKEYVSIKRLFKNNNWAKLWALRRKKYDLIIVGDVGFAPILTSFLIGARYRAGFNLRGRGFLLTHRVERSPENRLHETLLYLEIAKALGLKPENPMMDLFVPEREMDYAKKYYQSHGWSGDKRIICLFPGGGVNPGTIMPSKRWGEDKYASLADKLIKEYQANVLLLGGPGDRAVVDRVSGKMREKHLALSGKTTLKQSAALIKLAGLFIGNDCGPLHIAAAVGTPTISIFGPTDPQKLAPLGEKHIYIRSGVPCSPCYRQTEEYKQICQKYDCMDKIQVKDVEEAFKELLKRGTVK